MNNSDYNDFNAWQNGDENDMNNPNNWMPKNGFFFYGTNNEAFKKMWENLNKGEDITENMKEYFHMDDIWKKMNEKTNKSPHRRPNRPNPKPQQQPQNQQRVIFTYEEYNKLIEIRGYLAITEQMAHVKALDKLLSQVVSMPKDQR